MGPSLVQHYDGPRGVARGLLKDLVEEVATRGQHQPVHHEQATLTGQRGV